ncbi:hypothetical protein ACLOJK_040524 [Asimina triloba]
MHGPSSGTLATQSSQACGLLDPHIVATKGRVPKRYKRPLELPRSDVVNTARGMGRGRGRRDNSMKSPLRHDACKYHCMQTESGLDKFLHNSSGISFALEPLLVWAEHQIGRLLYDASLGTSVRSNSGGEDKKCRHENGVPTARVEEDDRTTTRASEAITRAKSDDDEDDSSM